MVCILLNKLRGSASLLVLRHSMRIHIVTADSADCGNKTELTLRLNILN